MKFKYVGRGGVKDLDLVIAGVCEAGDVLLPDTVIEIPDSDTTLIQRVRVNGNYVEVKKSTVSRKKEEKKEEKGEDK